MREKRRKHSQPQESSISIRQVVKYAMVHSYNIIYSAVLEKVIAKSVVGANIAEVCAFGDAELNGEVKHFSLNQVIKSIQQKRY